MLPHYRKLKLYSPNNIETTKMPRCNEYHSTRGSGVFHTHHFGLLVMVIIVEPTVIVKQKTVIKALFLYINLFLSVKLKFS